MQISRNARNAKRSEFENSHGRRVGFDPTKAGVLSNGSTSNLAHPFGQLPSRSLKFVTDCRFCRLRSDARPCFRHSRESLLRRSRIEWVAECGKSACSVRGGGEWKPATGRLVRHSQRKRGATDKPDLRVCRHSSSTLPRGVGEEFVGSYLYGRLLSGYYAHI